MNSSKEPHLALVSCWAGPFLENFLGGGGVLSLRVPT